MKDKSNAPCIFYCSDHPHRRSNAAVLICAYMIFCRNASIEEAYGPFIGFIQF